MQRPDRRVSLIIDLNHFFSVLKYLSTVHDVAGSVSAMRIALRTAGNIVLYIYPLCGIFTSPGTDTR